MRPSVLIIEPRPEVAQALEQVVGVANYVPVVRPYLVALADLAVTPAAIIIRISHEGVGEPPHAWLARLPAGRPPVVAIAWEDGDVREAQRLGCEAVLHGPGEVNRLCEELSRVIDAAATA